MKSRIAILSLLTITVLTSASLRFAVGQAPKEETGPAKSAMGKGAFPKRVEKSDREWAKILTRAQYLVTRQKATEPAFSGKLVKNHAKGIYSCVCCGEELFSSRTKFDSGTGWPSFYAPLKKERIATAPDYSEPSEVRIEVECATCDAHLGHVFSDGPPPSGLRYCLNSAALKFTPDKPITTAKAKAKAKTKTSTKPATDDPAGETEVSKSGESIDPK